MTNPLDDEAKDALAKAAKAMGVELIPNILTIDEKLLFKLLRLKKKYQESHKSGGK